MDFATQEPSSQYLVLHAVLEANPERASEAIWSAPQLAKRCAELCGKPCKRDAVAMTLRTKLEAKGLCTARKASRKEVLWVATAEARVLSR